MGVPRKKLHRAEKIEQARRLGHYPDRNWSPLSGLPQRNGPLGTGMLRATKRLEAEAKARAGAAKPKRRRTKKADA